MLDVIYGILEDIYNPTGDPTRSEQNNILAGRLARKIYEARTLHQSVMTEIWMNHDGGGTAEMTAEKIFATLLENGQYP